MDKTQNAISNNKEQLIQNLLSLKKLTKKEEKEILLIIEYLEKNMESNLEDFSLMTDIKTLCNYI
tara:strand:- start:12024 stop:12218 length:195 start_codon:yes stop_codon:yes gene_type:complete